MPIKDAAAQLGIKPNTLKKQAQAGRLTATKLGRDWYVTSREVERYREEQLDKRGYSKRRQQSAESEG